MFPGRNINSTKTVSTVQNSKWKRMTIFTVRKVVASINIWVRADKNYRDTLCNHSHRHHTQDWESTRGVTKTHLDKTFQWTWILWTLDKLSNKKEIGNCTTGCFLRFILSFLLLIVTFYKSPYLPFFEIKIQWLLGNHYTEEVSLHWDGWVSLLPFEKEQIT